MISKRFTNAVISGNDVSFEFSNQKYVIYKENSCYILENCLNKTKKHFDSAVNFQKWKIGYRTIEELSESFTEIVIYDYQFFAEMLTMGREIDFSVDSMDYFASHDEKKWYILNCQKTETFSFNSSEELLQNAKVNGICIKEAFENSCISVYIRCVY